MSDPLPAPIRGWTPRARRRRWGAPARCCSAFGACAGGLDVGHPASAGLFPHGAGRGANEFPRP